MALFGALDLGIIPMNGKCIDEALSSLTPEESRRARRKFRKLKRKTLKENPDIIDSIRMQKVMVHSMCVQRGKKIIDRK